MTTTTAAKNAPRSPAVKGQPVADPADWTGAAFAQRDDWIFRPTTLQIADLKSMAASVRAKFGDDPNALMQTTRDDFDLGEFGSTLAAVRETLTEGCGVALIRKLPMDDLTPLEAATIYWGIGRHLGRAVSNNPEGDMIGHVTDLGGDYDSPNQRGYQTRAAMDYHCDQSNFVGLLCVRTAKTGGLSKVASSVAMYNEMVRRHPEFVDVLAAPYCWTKHAEKNADEKGFYESPVFNFTGGRVCTSLGSAHMKKGHALPDAPDMTERQRAAMEAAEDICDELHYGMELERGDIQLCNNAVILHTRTAYRDWPDPAKKRLLWRLWLADDASPPPTPYHAQWRDGVHTAGTSLRVVL